jgi:6-phosphogluconate dehydrogenase
MKKQLGIVGLGKMGGNVARQLLEKDWEVVGFNRSPDDTQALEKEGMTGAYSIAELVEKLTGPRIVWIMLPAGPVIDEKIAELVPLLEKGDLIIDAGNSLYKDSQRRAQELEPTGIKFMDVGFSGGPGGARSGGCLMIGGTRSMFEEYEELFRDCAKPDAYAFFDGVGAGHFVKMVHNGIEYGMMQAIAEGFEVMKTSDYGLDLEEVARIYHNGSVIESRLTGWLIDAYKQYGQELEDVSSTVAHTGEGAWTVEAADELQVPVPVIKDSLEFRKQSADKPSYTGKVLSALRGQFGGHAIK